MWRVGFLLSGLILAALQTPNARERVGDASLYITGVYIGVALLTFCLLLLTLSKILAWHMTQLATWLFTSGLLLSGVCGAFYAVLVTGATTDLGVISPRVVGVLLLGVGIGLSYGE